MKNIHVTYPEGLSDDGISFETPDSTEHYFRIEELVIDPASGSAELRCELGSTKWDQNGTSGTGHDIEVVLPADVVEADDQFTYDFRTAGTAQQLMTGAVEKEIASVDVAINHLDSKVVSYRRSKRIGAIISGLAGTTLVTSVVASGMLHEETVPKSGAMVAFASGLVLFFAGIQTSLNSVEQRSTVRTATARREERAVHQATLDYLQTTEVAAVAPVE